ncbi:17455_t:CDS:2, partial [Cetraspora pellucida]
DELSFNWYKILDSPPGYVPIRTPARKLMATPTSMGEGMQHFGKLLEDKDESKLSVDELKERNIMPFIQSNPSTFDVAKFRRYLYVKVINCILYKLDALVHPYVHKILAAIEPLLIDEDYFARCVEVDEIRKLLNIISKKPETFIGFLVSNVPLSDYAQKELEGSKI